MNRAFAAMMFLLLRSKRVIQHSFCCLEFCSAEAFGSKIIV
jgi:hypothetical protein